MICMEVDGMKRVLFKVILPLAFIVVWLDMCYWIWDELTERPFEQWKLHIQLETGFSRGKAVEQPLIVVFQSAITTRTNV